MAETGTTTLSPPEKTYWRPDIQGLRGIAVLVVVAYHAGIPIPGGFIGVDVFFVISGFVITGLLLREHRNFGRIQLRTFFWRRFMRLSPALSAVVSVTLLLSVFALSPLGSQQVAAQTGIAAMLLSANYVIANNSGGYFSAPAEKNPLLNTWSLSVEEQFYIVCPFALAATWLLLRAYRYQRSLVVWPVMLIGLGSLAILSLGSLGISMPGVSIPPSFYSPFSRAWEFAVGAGLAVFLSSDRRISLRCASLIGALGAALLLIGLFTITVTCPRLVRQCLCKSGVGVPI